MLDTNFAHPSLVLFEAQNGARFITLGVVLDEDGFAIDAKNAANDAVRELSLERTSDTFRPFPHQLTVQDGARLRTVMAH